MAAPDAVLKLIELFDRNRDAYLSGAYKEAQLRHEFVDPFFKALGWDVYNESGYAEAYKDVIYEDAIKVGGFTKAPDYCFRTGGTRKFFVEAKKPSVDIKDEPSPAFQLRRYAWSAKLPLSILTDFEEFAVYDCRVKPVKIDKAGTARILYMTDTDYEKQWDQIASVFSREAVLQGSFDKYAEETRGKKGTAEVDDAFLNDIESWRDLIARNIALRNPALTQRELNFAVQQTIDRIIFLRICEDRGIEEYGRLMALLNGDHVYGRLFELFQRADERYNSGLFHFRKERGRNEPADELTPALAVDDKPLKEIVKNLYYPDSAYEFSVLPADILGQVYEQFLGKVIRLTPGHRAVVEDKPEVKKAGGVYYTPTYIVDYIVKNTVGKLLEDKTPKQAAKLRILDPACGSGSFLIGAYQYLLDWHRDWYYEDGPNKHTKELYQGAGGDWRLTTAERKRVLLNNIYGVDIDPQAVEVTKLSLLLKVLEGESEETLSKQLQLFHERALPDLSDNIKCGNSLIGPDFYDNQQMSLMDDEDRYRINAFDWETEFPEIMKAGGFDSIIGNPPYVRQEMLGELKTYFKEHYEVYHGVADLYVYFIHRGVSLLRNNGLFGFIVSNKWLRANYGEPLRRWLKKQHIEAITDFGDLPVFRRATTYPCILRIKKDAPSNGFQATRVKDLTFTDLAVYMSGNSYFVDGASLNDKGWSLADDRTRFLLEKIESQGVPLSEYVEKGIYYGIKTGLNEAFVIDDETRRRLITEDPKSADLIKPFLVGRDIKRYQQPSSERYLILIPNGWTRKNSINTKDAWEWFKKKYPSISNQLAAFASAAQKRYDQGEYWWELRPCEYYQKFEEPKMIVPAIVQSAAYTFDNSGFYSNDKTSIIATGNLYLLGLLNSKVLDFVMHSISSTKSGGYFEYKPMYLKKLPILALDIEEESEKERHKYMVSLVEQMLTLRERLTIANTPNEVAAIQRQIDTTDRQIDQLVYQLYGLTEEEIQIVEDATTH